VLCGRGELVSILDILYDTVRRLRTSEPQHYRIQIFAYSVGIEERHCSHLFDC
jgi:hypothetical protein